MKKTKFLMGLIVCTFVIGSLSACGFPFGEDNSVTNADNGGYVSMTSDEKEINEGLKESVLKIRTSEGTERTFFVEIADTFSVRRIGLMHRTEMDVDRGMLFVFDDEEKVAFWMKNTLIPLDMLFIDANDNIVHIAHDVPPCEADPCPSYPSVKATKYVLEINGGVANGLGIKEGDTVYLAI